MTEDPPMSDTPAVKLTKAQVRILHRANERSGENGVFTIRTDQSWMPMKALEQMGLLAFRTPNDSYRYITPAGRALLDALKEEGEDGHA